MIHDELNPGDFIDHYRREGVSDKEIVKLLKSSARWKGALAGSIPVMGVAAGIAGLKDIDGEVEAQHQGSEYTKKGLAGLGKKGLLMAAGGSALGAGVGSYALSKIAEKRARKYIEENPNPYDRD